MMMRRLNTRRWLVLGALSLAGCVGPNFHKPAAPSVERYTIAPLPPQTDAAPGPGGAAQRFLNDADVPRNWWTLYRSPQIDALVDEALRNNPNVTGAQAALRQAQETTAAQRGSFFPSVQGSFDAQRQLNAVGVLAPTLASGTAQFNLFTPGVTVSYVPDIFGANRRQVESLEAQAEAARFQLDATYLTLAANVVTTAIQAAGAQAQIDSTRQVIGGSRESLEVAKHQLELGAIAEIDVDSQEAVLAQLESSLAPLQKQREQALDALAVLTGHLPAQFTPPKLKLDQWVLPGDVPLGIPSQLVERRPDVRAAEASLHAATAQVGVAIANMLPQITITGTLGSTAPIMSELFQPGTGFWSIGANAAQTFFAGGTLLHRKRAADAALDQAAATYRSTVLTAFQNVADALHALAADAETLDAATRASEAAQKSLGIAQHQVDLGAVGYLALLAARLSYNQALVTTAAARANRYADTAALFQALGGSIAPPTPAFGSR